MARQLIPIPPSVLAELIQLEESGEISHKTAVELFEEYWRLYRFREMVRG